MARKSGKQKTDLSASNNNTTGRTVDSDPEKQVSIKKCLLLIALAFVLTTFFGLAFYDFWTETIGGGVFATAISTITILSFIWSFFGISIKKINIKSATIRNCIVGVSVGIVAGIICIHGLHECGIAITVGIVNETVSSPIGDEVSDEHSMPPSFEPSTIPSVSPSDTTSKAPPVESPDVSVEPTIPNDGIDVSAPDIVLPITESFNKEDIFTPDEEAGNLLSVIDNGLLDLTVERTVDNKEQWRSFISDSAKKKINTASQPDSDTVNGDVFFTQNVKEANELESEIRKNGMNRDKLNRIINLRQQAYEKYAVMDLRVLLSNGYHELARLQNASEEWENAYKSYLTSISYELSCIQISFEVNDTYYKHLYNVGVLYQCIGDIGALCIESKKEAYFLSACFLEIAATNTYEPENERVGFLSNYYAGMVNHKLALIGWGEKSRNSYHYIIDALSYYDKSLSFSKYGKQRNYQYIYLSQVCEIAQRYINYFGQPAEMLSYSEYTALIKDYKAKIK